MQYRKALFGGFIGMLIALALSWLIDGETSPLSRYFLYSGGDIQNLWWSLNFPSYFVGALVAGNPHSVNESVAWSVFLIQWFAIGFVLTTIVKSIYPERGTAGASAAID